MAGVVDALMIDLCGSEWKGKLVGIATDGARSMLGGIAALLQVW
jgi:hypothetical protein